LKKIGIQSGRSRAPILHFLAALLTSRDPVGIQSGTNFRVFGTTFGPVGKQLKSPENVPKLCKHVVFYEFGCLPTLMPDWIPTGSDWIPTGSMDRQEPTHAPIFPCPDPPLPLLSFSAHQPQSLCPWQLKACWTSKVSRAQRRGSWFLHVSLDESV
jgi:hypothetical protein